MDPQITIISYWRSYSPFPLAVHSQGLEVTSWWRLFGFIEFSLCMQESADNVSPESSSPSKDALLEEACRKYEEATRLCPTLNDVSVIAM